jgi:steroid delta-isomerase-like uncharacterized protein
MRDRPRGTPADIRFSLSEDAAAGKEVHRDRTEIRASAFFVFRVHCYVKMEAMMNGKADPKQVMKKLLEAYNSHDAAAVAALYVQDAITKLNLEVTEGREAIEQLMIDWFRAFPDMKIDFWHYVVSEEYVAVECTLRATHTGPFTTPEGEIPATGRKVDLPYAFVAKVNPDGLVQEDRTYFDTATMMQQLGLS